MGDPSSESGSQRRPEHGGGQEPHQWRLGRRDRVRSDQCQRSDLEVCLDTSQADLVDDATGNSIKAQLPVGPRVCQDRGCVRLWVALRLAAARTSTAKPGAGMLTANLRRSAVSAAAAILSVFGVITATAAPVSEVICKDPLNPASCKLVIHDDGAGEGPAAPVMVVLTQPMVAVWGVAAAVRVCRLRRSSGTTRISRPGSARGRW